MININKIKLMLPKLHVMSGIGGDFVGADWSIDYSLNLDDEFNEDVAELGLAINFLSAAVRKSDLPAIMCALVRVRGRSNIAEGFFANIVEDLDRVGWSEGGRLRDVPKTSAVPEIYELCKSYMFYFKGFNELKFVMPCLYELSGLKKGFFSENWKIDYTSNLDGEFSGEVADFQMHLDALDEAVRINDLVAVKYALAMARSSSRALSDFFERICDDIENIGWADDRPWADIPEDYELPASYNYSGK